MLKRQAVFKFMLAALGAFATLGLVGQSRYVVDAFEIQTRLSFSNFGFTQFFIPPFGSIRAKTHFAPLGLSITLTSVDLEKLHGLIFSGPSQSDLYVRFRYPLQVMATHYILKMMLLATLGGGLIFLILEPRRIRHILYGGSIGFVIGLLLLVLVLGTFSFDGFLNPEYRGMLQTAPWMIALAREALLGVETLGEQIQLMSTNLYYLLQQVERIEQRGIDDSVIKVLHVSDIHNNPVALDLVKQVSDTFSADLIIDTGDITDYGSPLETGLLNRLENFTIPYLITLGNHDSPIVARHLEDIPNVIVLGDKIIEVAGITVMGFEDPAAKRETMMPADQQEIINAQDAFKKLMTGNRNPPDIMAVHDYRLAKNFTGDLPVILHGHTHRHQIKEEKGTIVIDAGTTGAAGIRGLLNRDEVPFTLVLLHFIREPEKVRLFAADSIVFFHRKIGFELNRTFFPLHQEGDDILE